MTKTVAEFTEMIDSLPLEDSIKISIIEDFTDSTNFDKSEYVEKSVYNDLKRQYIERFKEVKDISSNKKDEEIEENKEIDVKEL